MRKTTLVFVSLSLAACEAPLILDGLQETSHQPIRRTDVFMAATEKNNTMIVVGSEGVVLSAEKGTTDWTRYQIPEKPSLIEVATCPNGLLASLSMEGDVWTSKDDITKWSAQSLGTPEVPQALTCDASNTLWVVGSFSTILSSTDAGKTWIDASLGEDTILSTVQFVDEQTGYITGEFGYVLKTENAGQSWEFLEPIPNEFSPLAGYFTDGDHGWVTGLNGTIYETRDAGGSWEKTETNTSAPLFGVTEVSDRVIAVGDYGTVIEREKASVSDWRTMPMPVESRFFYRLNQKVNGTKVLIGGAGMLSLVDLDESK